MKSSNKFGKTFSTTLPLKKNTKLWLKYLSDFLAIPSVSTLSEHKKDMEKGVEWLISFMKESGLKNITSISTKGHPLVYGEWTSKKNLKTVLIYGHYDVQPVDPLNEWKSDPFKMTIKKDKIFARGASDDKGQILAHLIAVREILNTQGKLPVNIKFIIEGEEEIGSINFLDALKKNKERFKADMIMISDGGMKAGQPIIEYGLRGLTGLSLEVKTLSKDAHSGIWGGTIDNPIIVLSYIISKLKDRNGRILIPHFYKDVRKISKNEIEMLRKVEIKDTEVMKYTGAKQIFGEQNMLNVVRIGARPTLDIHGITGGFSGTGLKTIIPSKASAKISMRLVPNQNPKKIFDLFVTYVNKIKPKTAEIKITPLAEFDPVLIDTSSKYMKTIKNSLKKAFGRDPLFQLAGGSIGIVKDIQKVLRIDPILLGFALEDSNTHGPNENFPVDQFIKAINTSFLIINDLGKTKD